MSILAQVPDMNLTAALVIYGPMGIFCAWFMMRVEKLIGEVRTLSHRIEGITKAMLVDVMSRESSGENAREIARDMLAKIDDRTA